MITHNKWWLKSSSKRLLQYLFYFQWNPLYFRKHYVDEHLSQCSALTENHLEKIIVKIPIGELTELPNIVSSGVATNFMEIWRKKIAHIA